MEKVGKSAIGFTINAAGFRITIADSVSGRMLPNLRVMVDGKPRYLTLTTTAERQFPEGEKPAEWKSLTTELLAEAIRVQFGWVFDDDEVVKQHLWTAYTHEAHDVRNCGRIQSVRVVWKMHLHLPFGLNIKVRAWQESDARIKTPVVIIDTEQGKLTGLVSSICPDALDHYFGISASTITIHNFALQIRNDYPFLEDWIKNVTIAGWKEHKEVTHD